MMLDIFNQDAFSVTKLSLAIQELPYVPGQISRAGIFGEEGIETTTFSIESRGMTLGLVPSQSRGAPNGKIQVNDKAKLIPFNTLHLPQRWEILADEVLNKRAFGSESELEMAQTLVNRKVAKCLQDHAFTMEYQRLGALRGQVLDADGTTVLLDLFTTFGISQTTFSFVLGTAGTDVNNKCVQVARLMDEKLDGIGYSGLRAYVSPSFYDKFTTHASVKEAFSLWNTNTNFLQTDNRRGFVFGGIEWIEYRGRAPVALATDEAYLVPLGVSDLAKTYYAPANYMETVGTTGLPYYAKMEPMSMNKGMEGEFQSNPISIVTRPQAIIKLTA